MKRLDRIERDKRTIEFMVRLYCLHNEGNTSLCASCSELLTYSLTRLDSCRYGVNKSSCKKCPTHCYKPQMRQQIRKVMRYSGSRMMFYAPLDFLRHLSLFSWLVKDHK